MGDAFSVPFILSCQRQNCCFQLILLKAQSDIILNFLSATRTPEKRLPVYAIHYVPLFFFSRVQRLCLKCIYNLKNHSIKRKRPQVALLLNKRPTNAVGCSCWSGEAINSFSRGWLYFKFSFKVTEEVETALVTRMLILSYKNSHKEYNTLEEKSFAVFLLSVRDLQFY